MINSIKITIIIISFIHIKQNNEFDCNCINLIKEQKKYLTITITYYKVN